MTFIVTMVASLIGGNQFIARIIVGGALILMAATAYGIWHHKVWSNGYDRALVDIAQQDDKAIARAREYRDRVRACSADGLRWDQSTGKCLRR